MKKNIQYTENISLVGSLIQALIINVLCISSADTDVTLGALASEINKII